MERVGIIILTVMLSSNVLFSQNTASNQETEITLEHSKENVINATKVEFTWDVIKEHIANEEYEQAIPYLKTLKNIFPKNDEIYFYLAKSCFMEGDYEKSIKYYTQYLDMNELDSNTVEDDENQNENDEDENEDDF